MIGRENAKKILFRTVNRREKLNLFIFFFVRKYNRYKCTMIKNAYIGYALRYKLYDSAQNVN